jgi:hypothetical protein
MDLAAHALSLTRGCCHLILVLRYGRPACRACRGLHRHVVYVSYPVGQGAPAMKA